MNVPNALRIRRVDITKKQNEPRLSTGPIPICNFPQGESEGGIYDLQSQCVCHIPTLASVACSLSWFWLALFWFFRVLILFLVCFCIILLFLVFLIVIVYVVG